ncbi:MAG: ribonuclease III [Patescibacteria group bacterium]|nr:ribonuclease III [Patescibacteria group bacterium]
MAKDKFEQLAKTLKFNFKKIDLLKQAFTHRSYLNENHEWRLGHNERLEFLGDAVLELVVSEYLFKKYPNENEGFLTSLRASLVNAETLASVADKLNFGHYVLVSRGEAKDNGVGRRYILANTFEALIGAIYLDGGYKKCQQFIEKFLIKDNLERIIKEGSYKDPKSLLQEKAQAELGVTPAYKTLDEWGPDHAKHFRVGVFFYDKLVDEGEGPSKRIAEQEAAKKALSRQAWQEFQDKKRGK